MGQNVKLLTFTHSAVKGITHEVREDRLMGFGLFFGTKKQCLQWIADQGMECTNLHLWGDHLPTPQLFSEGRSR